MDRQSQSERLRQARIASGYPTAAEAARKFGWNPVAYRHHENATSGYKTEQAAAYAQAFGVTPEWLIFGTGAPPGADIALAFPSHLKDADLTVPVLGEVAAGVWRETPPGLEIDRATEFLPRFTAGYPNGARMFGLRVVGPSMNQFYPDGTFVFVVPAAEIGLRGGDHVVVQRHRIGLTETTIKEVQKEDGQLVLIPHSTDPKFQEPLRYRIDEHDQDGLEIIGVVVGSYNHRQRPDGPLI